jgi:hypothetical protein
VAKGLSAASAVSDAASDETNATPTAAAMGLTIVVFLAILEILQYFMSEPTGSLSTLNMM